MNKIAIIGLPLGIEELLVAAGIVFLLTLIYRLLMNQEEAKELKQKQKEKQEKIKELQKTNPGEANKMMNEMLKLTHKQFRMTMKPMLVSFVVVIIILYFLPGLFPGVIVELPFSLPFIGDNFGWLAWYIIVSIPLNSIFRKILGVNI